MKYNIVFTIVVGLFLTSCSRSYLAGIDPDSTFLYSRKPGNLVAVGPNIAPAGELFWKKGVSIEETAKEYYACRKEEDSRVRVNSEIPAHESINGFYVRRRNGFNACMLKKGFAYMDRGININYDSDCQRAKSTFNIHSDVCK